MTRIEIIRRDDVRLTVTITDDEGNPLNLTGATVYFTVKENRLDSDEDALITAEVTSHVNPTGGLTEIDLTQEQTDLEARSYFFDVQVKDASDRIRSINYGLIRVQQDITVRTN